MRLAEFILGNMESILQEWEDFARTIQPSHRSMNVAELRDHAEEMLKDIAKDLSRSRSLSEKLARSKGQDTPRTTDSAAHDHALQRLQSGFSIDQLVAEYRALRTSVLHLWSKQHRAVGALEVEDISRFNDALDQALSESVARYSLIQRQAQDILIGILGHDIRTPLNAIRIGSETLMRNTALDARSIQIASRLFSSTMRISELVDSLLDLTQARFGMKLSLRPVDMGLLAEQVMEEIRAAHPDRELILRVAGDAKGHWDAGRLSQIISNLICNALQHGSPTHPITVCLNADIDYASLSVHNFGPSIPQTELGHIFEPMRRYAQASQKTQYSLSNLGLGLYIAREVAIAHGGSITVASGDEDGTRFEVCLPKGKAA